jgi:hypothetical protein
VFFNIREKALVLRFQEEIHFFYSKPKYMVDVGRNDNEILNYRWMLIALIVYVLLFLGLVN